MKYAMKLTVAVFVVLFLASFTTASATVLIYDSFTGNPGSDLPDDPPDVDILVPGGAWEGNSAFIKDGSQVNYGVTASVSISLGSNFVTNYAGQIVTLSADFKEPTGVGATDDAVALAFQQTGGGTMWWSAAASPWIYLRRDGHIVAAGSTVVYDDTAGSIVATPNAFNKLEIRWDLGAKTGSFYVNNIFLANFSYTTNPNVTHVSMGAWSSYGGTVDNFSLTAVPAQVVPEPATCLFLALGSLGLLRKLRM